MLYKTFKRRATNWKSFSTSRKTTVDRNLTIDEAIRSCKAFNEGRTSAQIRSGLRMEFTAQ